MLAPNGLESFADMLISHIILLQLAASGLRAASPPVDCTRRPEHMLVVRDCCDVPHAKYKPLEQQCSSLKHLNVNRINSCQYECIFNVYHVMAGRRINTTALDVMLSGNIAPEFGEAYRKGYNVCNEMGATHPEVLVELEQLAKGRGSKCSPIPMIYTVCAHWLLFENCPKKAWYTSKKCEVMKKYFMECSQMQIYQNLITLLDINKTKGTKKPKANSTTKQTTGD